MISRIATFVPVILAAASLVSCAAPERKAPAGDIESHESEIVAYVKKLAPAYPDISVTDFTPALGSNKVCALVRSNGRTPHVLYAWIENGRVRVTSPTLLSPDTWESEGNRGLSGYRAQQCENEGMHLPAA